jgi:amidase
MKDLFDFRPGWPSTLGGIPALRGYMPNNWSTYPKRIEQADAILIGKTNSPIMGFPKLGLVAESGRNPPSI